MKNVSLGARTVVDIDGQVAKVLRGLGNPDPLSICVLCGIYSSWTADTTARQMIAFCERLFPA